MNILAIDTTTKKAQVAISSNGTIVFECVDNEITHSEKLLPLIDKMLKKSKLDLKDIDLFALTIGPGSFTGVRIGIATIKAIAMVYSTPILDTTSLKLYAINGINNIKDKVDYVIPLMDAKNNRVYFSLYKCNGSNTLEETNINGNLPIDEAIKYIHENISNGSILFTGDSATNYSTNIQRVFSKDNIIILDSSLYLPDIFSIAQDFKTFKTYLTLDATYYRSSEAERNKKGE